MTATLRAWMHSLAWAMVLLGILSAAFIAFDIARRHPQRMTGMRYVWPINTLWAGIFGVWVYWNLGRMGPRSTSASPGMSSTAMNKSGMSMDEPAARLAKRSHRNASLRCRMLPR